MSEYKTLDQWFPDGRGDGRKFLVFMSSDYIVEPVIKAIPFGYGEQVWFVVDEKGRLDSFSDHMDVRFKEYVAPKKKVTKYLWYNNYSKTTYPYMAKDLDELHENLHCNGIYIHLGAGNYTRLDWSATEFDDE